MRLFLCISIVLLFVVRGLQGASQHNPQGFSHQSQNSYEQDEYDAQAQTPVAYRQRYYDYSNEEETSDEQTRQNYQNKRQQPQFNRKDKKPLKAEEELVEEEEPDRLTLLLQKSAFKCDGRTTGYYADETLGCEVFHYCQENQRHSWICPDGFTFHQVHLICMPPSGENICEESSKYHIVNEYLYKPINVEEHETKPNITLRYSERYYPETFYQDERQPYQDERIQSHRQPIQVGLNNQRKPSTTAVPPVYRFAATPTPQQTVFRSPEEINISLQQRRPQTLFLPQTPRYSDEDYGYEK